MEPASGRRAQILRTAAELFANRGVPSTTMRQIADEVGMLSGSLYHHFESKEAMVDEIISSYLEDLLQRYERVLTTGTDPRAQLHDMVLTSLQVAASHPYATEIYQNEANYLRGLERFSYLPKVSRQVQRAWLRVLEAGIADGSFRADVPPKIFYNLVRDAVWLSVRWFRATPKYPLARLAEDCTSVFLDGFSTRASASP